MLDQTEAPAPEVTVDLDDGIYFGMEEDDYFAIPRLSSSGVKNMLISPATFWAASWLNPNKEPRKDKAHQIIGKAYHAARFEPATFDARFCRALEKADLPDALMTHNDIKAALKELGLPQTKAGESVLAAATRLMESGYEGQIWHLEIEAFEDGLNGKAPIPGEVWDRLHRDMAMLVDNPEVAEKLSGGEGEVVILWTDARSGLPLKAKIDCLKPTGYTDLKTFENTRGKWVEDCIRDAFRYNGYFLQGGFYWRAVETIRQKLVGIIGEATPDQKALIAAIQKRTTPMECWFVFQEKGGVPNLMAREFCPFAVHRSLEIAEAGSAQAPKVRARYGEPTRLYRKAEMLIESAFRQFISYSECYPPGKPWFPFNAVSSLVDDDFNNNWLDGER